MPTTTSITAKDLTAAIEASRARSSSHTLIPYEPSDTAVNEYCFFLKPEAVSALDRVWPLIRDVLAANSQEIVSIAALDGAYLGKYKLIEAHYGVINTIARLGLKALTPAAREKMSQLKLDEPGLLHLGAYEFLERYPFFTPQALGVYYDSQQNIKLGGGTHCIRVTVKGQPIVLFNGFHPEQVERYTQKGSGIVTFTVRTNMSWKDMRTKVIGATDPRSAVAGSIRAELLRRKEELKLEEVSAGMNGVHASAGPLEAIAELARYMSERDANRIVNTWTTSLGKRLLGHWSREQLEHATNNGLVKIDGKELPAFDATEEIDAATVIEKIAKGNLEVAAR
jgi:hypothetical protein